MIVFFFSALKTNEYISIIFSGWRNSRRIGNVPADYFDGRHFLLSRDNAAKKAAAAA
jgi:hypothetical protein